MGKSHTHRNGMNLINLQNQLKEVGIESSRRARYLSVIRPNKEQQAIIDSLVLIGAIKDIVRYSDICWLYPLD